MMEQENVIKSASSSLCRSLDFSSLARSCFPRSVHVPSLARSRRAHQGGRGRQRRGGAQAEEAL